MYSNNLLVIYGQKPLQMAYEIMSAANVKSMLSKDMKIALKPNLVVEKPHTSGATTSPEIVEGIVKYLKDNGGNRMIEIRNLTKNYGTIKAIHNVDFTVVNMGMSQKNIIQFGRIKRKILFI
jgi:uncharacterized protein (DUF362 family)